MALYDACDLKNPEEILRGRRHYIFDAAWGGFRGFGPDRTSTGAVKAPRVVLERNPLPAGGTYRFAFREDLQQAKAAMLLFRACNMTLSDHIQVGINGTPVPPADLRFRNNETRVDLRRQDEESIQTFIDQGYSREVAESLFPGPSPPFVTAWFDLRALPMINGWNHLELELGGSDPEASDPIIVEEVEVYVIPRTGHG